MTPEPITATQVRDLIVAAASSPCEHVGYTRFGPLPVVVRSQVGSLVAHAVRHSTGDPAAAPWPPVTVHLLDRDALPEQRLPRVLVDRAAVVDGPTWCFVDGDCIATPSASMVWIADSASRQAMRWTVTPADVPDWEAPRPLRFALRWATAMHGAALLHCAAVAGPTGAVLLTGRGGAGKSTTSFACLGNGLRLLGDDYCIVDPTTPTPTVYSTYVLGMLDDRSLSLLPHLRDRVVGDAPTGKKVIALDDLGGESSAPVVAACAVVQAPGERTRLAPMSKAALLRSLAPSTQAQINGFNRETFAATTELVRRVQTFELRVSNLADVPQVLGELIGAP